MAWPSAIAAAPIGGGSTAANFLKLDLAPRPVSLGGAFTGLADDVNAISYNPAGLAFLTRQEATFMHNEYVRGVRQESLAYAHPSRDRGTLGVSVNSVQVAPFNAFDADDRPAGKVSAQDLAVGAAYARALGPWGLGAHAKYLSSRLDNVRAGGGALDLGILRTVPPYFRVGASARNLGPDFKFAQESFPLPVSGHLGASARLPLAWQSSWLLLTAEGAWDRDLRAYPRAGAEFEPAEAVALRVGYDGRQDAGMGISAGVGLRLIRSGVGWYSSSEHPGWVPDIDFDYAFAGLGDLGNAHRFGVLFKFGSAAVGPVPAGKLEPKRASGVRKRPPELVPEAPQDPPKPDMIWIQP